MDELNRSAVYVLLVECSDRAGLVHEITGVLFRSGVNVTSNHEFVDSLTRRFFMRTAFEGTLSTDDVRREIEAILPKDAKVGLRKAGQRRIVILVSREHHCLADLLIRHAYQELGADIQAIVSNHENLKPLAEKFSIPFHTFDHSTMTREAHEEAIQALIGPMKPDYIVLAKYMRVLSPHFVAAWPQRIVNIHHSFLPAFVGPRPYHQAFERGVKVIGATAHFVTDKLDEGPIVAQQVIATDHSQTPSDLASAGRDIEQMVLSRSLKLVLEDRVFLCGNRTIIFD